MKTRLPLLSTLFCLLLFWVVSCKKTDDPVVTPTPTPTTKSAAKAITAFAFNALSPALTATIDATAKTISATVPAGTDVTKLVPTLTLSDKATVSPASGVAQDFSKAVTYTVTAEDGSTQAYSVTVISPVVNTAKVIAVATHGLSTFVLKEDGTLWVSGLNYHGEFGIGQTDVGFAQKGFVKIMTDVKDLAVGTDAAHMVVIKNDNTAWAAGYNANGQLGNGEGGIDHKTGNRITSGPLNGITSVKILSDVKAIAIGDAHTLFLKTDNTLWGTGRNDRGALGDGTTVDKNLPFKMMSDVKAISAGGYHSLILKTDNTLWATGENANGQLGYTRNTAADLQTLNPVKVADNVKAISAGEFSSFFIKNDNTLWFAGFNSFGNSGNGTTNSIGLFENNAFQQVMTNVQGVVAATSYTLILKTDNTLWATGNNQYGQLGDGTTTDKTTFIKIMDGVKYMIAGTGAARSEGSSYILKTDNTFWGVGNNAFGQLGDGTATDRSIFVPISVK